MTILSCMVYGSLQWLWQVSFGFVHYCCQSLTLSFGKPPSPLTALLLLQKKRVHLPCEIVEFSRMLDLVLMFFFFFLNTVNFKMCADFSTCIQSYQMLIALDGSEKLLFVFQPTRTSSESIYSRPGSSIPGSPGHTIYVSIPSDE